MSELAILTAKVDGLIDGLGCQLAEIKKQLDNTKPPTTNLPPTYLPRKQVADLLNVSVVTIDDWTGRGLLISYRLGNRIYYKTAEVEAALVQIPKRKGGANG